MELGRIGSRLAALLVGTGAVACTLLAVPAAAGALAVPHATDLSDLAGVASGLTSTSDLGIQVGLGGIDLTVDGESGLQVDSGDAAALASAAVDADVAGVVGVDATAAVGTGSLDLSAALDAAGQTVTATVGAGSDGLAVVAGAGDAGLEVGVSPTGAGIDLGLSGTQVSGAVAPGAALTGTPTNGGAAVDGGVDAPGPIGTFMAAGHGSGSAAAGRGSSSRVASSPIAGSGGDAGSVARDAGTPARAPGMRLASALARIELDGAAGNHSLLVFLTRLGGDVLPALLLLLAVVALRRHTVMRLRSRGRQVVSPSTDGTAATA